MKRDLFAYRFLNSRVHADHTQKSEQIFGYFIGPCLVFMVYSGLAGTYLTQFYTDVLGLSGSLLTMMPLVSKLLSGVISVCIGRMIDKTRTAQGKARPWLLISGILVAVCGVLLYAVPRASYAVQIAWVVISYNLFFSLAYSTYSLSHALMVPLSTRDTKQRDSLAMLTSTGTSMIPGMLTTIVMPLLIRYIGVGADAHGSWLTVMSVLSIIAVPAVLLEYYFTRERVSAGLPDGSTERSVSFARQLSACLKDRYWVMILFFAIILQLCNGMSTNSMLYYCNWVLGSSIDAGATKQILVNMIGQAPLGIGVVILWPLVRKFGKRRVIIAGFLMAAAGSLLVLFGNGNMVLVLSGLFIKSTGSLPSYVMAALLAEALDHVEMQNGFRADGISTSINGIAQSAVGGLTQTVLLGGIYALGYITPSSTSQIIVQSDAIRTFFSWCFAGVPMLCYIVCAVIMLFYDVEARMKMSSEKML